jgi:6-phosphogluconate dehydrogenase
MELAMVGLGRMGVNMATRLMRGNHRIVAYDLNEAAITSAEAEGAEGARSLDELKAKLPKPRIAWVMVPAGEPTEKNHRGLGQYI